MTALQRSGCAAISVALGIAAAAVLRCLAHRYAEQSTALPSARYEPEFSVSATALLAMPTQRGRWYVFRWEECLAAIPPADTRYRIDREDFRQIAWGAYRAMPSNYVRRTAVFFARSDQRHIRIMASPNGELHMRHTALYTCPLWVGLTWQYWWIVICGGLVSAGMLLRTSLRKTPQHLITSYQLASNGVRWRAALACGAFVYTVAAAPVVVHMLYNNGWQDTGRVVRHVAMAPLGIVTIMYLCGWPFIDWVLHRRRRSQCEVLLAMAAGLAVLMCTLSLSAAGIRSHVIALGVVLYVLYGWSRVFSKGLRPVAPDMPSLATILAAFIGLWIMMWPMRTQRDIWPSTMHNGDITVYITETAGYHQWSAREIWSMAFSSTEPTFLAYKADSLRSNHFRITYLRVSDATEHAMAVLAWMLHTAPEHVVGAYNSVLIPLLLMSVTGALRLWLSPKYVPAWFVAAAILTCFPLIYLQRDAYFNNLHGLLLTLVTYIVLARALAAGCVRLAVVAGAASAALCMSFLIVVPILAAALAAYSGMALCAGMYTRAWPVLKRAPGVLLAFIATNVMAAPQLVYLAGYDLLHGRLGTNLFTARTRYPERSWTILGGFIADWFGQCCSGTAVVWYQRASAALTVLLVLAVLLWLCVHAARHTRLLVGALLVATGCAIAWTYVIDTSRYGYFKNLIIGAAVLSVCASVAWATLARDRTLWARLIRYLLCGWMALRFISWPFALVATTPIRFLNEKTASLRTASTVLPPEACILVASQDRSDYYYTPLLHMYLYGFMLRSSSYIGYSKSIYPGNDYTHILTSHPSNTGTLLWQNGYYWLYAVSPTNRPRTLVPAH